MGTPRHQTHTSSPQKTQHTFSPGLSGGFALHQQVLSLYDWHVPSEHTGRQETSLLSSSCHHLSYFSPSHSLAIDFLKSYIAAFSYFLFLLAHYSFPPSILFSPFSNTFLVALLSVPTHQNILLQLGRGMQWCLCATGVLRGDALSDVLPISYTNSHYHNRVKRLSSSHQIPWVGLQVEACMFMGVVDSESCACLRSL